MRWLLESAFQEGCGLSLQRIMASEWFHNAVEQDIRRPYSSKPRFIERDQSTLVPQMPFWRSHNLMPRSIDRSYHEERVLLLLLGKLLVDEAEKFLPAGFAHAAKVGWNRSSRLEIDNFMPEFQKVMFDINRLPKNPFEAQFKQADSMGETEQVALGRFPHTTALARCWHNERPSCLGMSQIVTAFARLTGCPYHFVTVLVYQDQKARQISKDFCLKIAEDCALHNFQLPEDQKEFIDCSIKDADIWGGQWQYHYAVSLRDPFGRWWLLDPYCHMCRTYDDYEIHNGIWELENAHAILHPYHDEVPGTVALLHDNSFMDALQDYLEADVISSLATAAEFRNMYQDKPDEADICRDLLNATYGIAARGADAGLYWYDLKTVHPVQEWHANPYMGIALHVLNTICRTKGELLPARVLAHCPSQALWSNVVPDTGELPTEVYDKFNIEELATIYKYLGNDSLHHVALQRLQALDTLRTEREGQ